MTRLSIVTRDSQFIASGHHLSLLADKPSIVYSRYGFGRMSISGFRQHILPRFLIKGFASRRVGPNHLVWVFEKHKARFESNIINVAVERDFYSGDDSSVDEEITHAEIGFAALLDDLRSKKEGGLVNGDILSNFIAHLAIRTRHVRESFLEISEVFLTEVTKYFQKHENVNGFISEQLDRAINAQLKKISFTKARKPYIDATIKEMKRSLRPHLETQFSMFITRLLPRLVSDMPAIVKRGHLRALRGSVSPKLRVKECQKLGWNLVYLDTAYFILGDFGVLFEIEFPHKEFATIWESGDKIKNVFLPISKNHLVVGSNSMLFDMSDYSWLNREIAECSREYFLSAINDPNKQNLASYVGTKSHWLTDREIKEICNELFENDAAKVSP